MSAPAPLQTATWLDQLNPEQRAAATHSGGPLLILAGAGTGKTTTLCARVAWLIDEGLAPERIMLLTFTRRAAREMLQRTRALVSAPGGSGGVVGAGGSGAGGVVGGTFHSVAHRLVRTHASALGLERGFGLLDAGDAADLLDLIREEHGHAQSAHRFPKKGTLLDIYWRTVNAQRTLSEVVAEAFPWCGDHVEAIAALFKAYTARKRALSVLDLDDLLLYWRALVADQVIGAAVEAAIDHVLIDEYQDVNGLQVEIVRGLRRERREVTVVGDDLQAIYGWRSASAEHILEFERAFPHATVVTLERNYRSSQPILDTANAVAAQAPRSYPKRLRADGIGSGARSRAESGSGKRPELIFCRDESAQAAEVCDRVLRAREEGMELRQQAVLMRASHDSDLLELELTRRRIPFVKYGGLRYLEAAHVKDLIALFRLVHNPVNELSWFRLLQLIEGVGPVTARRALNLMIGGAPADPLAAWPQARERLPAAAHSAADSLIDALRLARAETSRGTRTGRLRAGAVAQPTRVGAKAVAGAQAERLRDALAPLIRCRYSDGAVRMQDLDQLVAAARESADLTHFVAELALDPPQSSSDLAGPPHLDEDYLELSTIHSAKGLEWGAVHVLALYDGNFPACMAAGTNESIDEERRLLYVALTRPRRQLHLYVPVRYHHRPKGIDDAHGYGKPSRFLSDEVQRTCDVTRLVDDLRASARSNGTPRRIVVSVDGLLR